MKSSDGETTSIWYERAKIPQFSPPSGARHHADVCIVGAGIAGLTTAYFLAAEGMSVIVLDEGAIGSGQTGRTSAHLASAIDDRFIEIERMHGAVASRLACQSHATAIDAIEHIAREEKIDCDFKRLDGLLTAIPSDPPDYLDRELAAAQRAGFPNVAKLARGGFGNKPCLRFGNQARFHPLKYLVGLAAALKRKSVHIFTGRRVMDVQGADRKKNKPGFAKLQGRAKHITADHMVVATNTPSPINDWFGIYTKQAAYRSYVIAAPIPAGAVKDALYWDTGDPYHYVRLEPAAGRRAKDTLIIGGEDHKVGQFPSVGGPFANLEAWARKHFPEMGKITHRWSGQVQEPADGLAFIGRALTKKEEVFVATGDSGMGLTHGTIAGLLIRDLIMGRKNPWEKIYDPSRKILNREFIRENANTLAQYSDLLTAGEFKSADDIPPGYGGIVREGVKKIAVYRSPQGKICRRSALCTHMECVVQWNPAESSWDCPCHGSRFDPQGAVLIGPAVDDLPPAGTH